MQLRDEILKEHSRAQALRIAGWIGDDAERFRELMQLFLTDIYRVVQRAAWIVSMVAEKQPALIIPYLEAMVGKVGEQGVPVAVKRNVVRILQHIDIPEGIHGEVMNMCFDLLNDPKETVAVRAFSMTVLGNLAKAYPEIKQELRAVIEDILEHSPTAGMRSRGRSVLGGL